MAVESKKTRVPQPRIIFMEVLTMNQTIRKVAEEAGWVQKYMTKTSARYVHENGKSLDVCKESIPNKNRWRVSLINPDGTINDTDGLKQKEATVLMKVILNAETIAENQEGMTNDAR